jgi:hypothetical protein
VSCDFGSMSSIRVAKINLMRSSPLVTHPHTSNGGKSTSNFHFSTYRNDQTYPWRLCRFGKVDCTSLIAMTSLQFTKETAKQFCQTGVTDGHCGPIRGQAQDPEMHPGRLKHNHVQIFASLAQVCITNLSKKRAQLSRMVIWYTGRQADLILQNGTWRKRVRVHNVHSTGQSLVLSNNPFSCPRITRRGSWETNSGSIVGDGDHQSRSFDKIVWQFILQTTISLTWTKTMEWNGRYGTRSQYYERWISTCPSLNIKGTACRPAWTFPLERAPSSLSFSMLISGVDGALSLSWHWAAWAEEKLHKSRVAIELVVSDIHG